MKLNQLRSNNKNAGKRVGRGTGSGKGRASGRGHKGQKSRSGFNIPKRFEGGQTSLIQRLPKARGFSSNSNKPNIVAYKLIQEKFNEGDVINPKVLRASRLVKLNKFKVKILGPYVGKKQFVFKNCSFSKSFDTKKDNRLVA